MCFAPGLLFAPITSLVSGHSEDSCSVAPIKLSSNDPPKLAILHPAITLTDAETVNGDVNNDSATYEVPRNTPASHETTMPVTVTPPLVP
jgi:hypothetical protein